LFIQGFLLKTQTQAGGRGSRVWVSALSAKRGKLRESLHPRGRRRKGRRLTFPFPVFPFTNTSEKATAFKPLMNPQPRKAMLSDRCFYSH
jgi:hypothetical protein